jgi:phosphopantetheine adenylyltransferase
MGSSDTPHLLLLPPPPRPATRASLDAAYRPSITSVLSKLGLASTSPAPQKPSSAVLVIALTAPVLAGRHGSPSPKVSWKYAQSLIAGLYTTIAIVCAQHGVQTDMGAAESNSGGPDNIGSSLDARIVLVDHVRGRAYEPAYDGSFRKHNGTPIMDLAAFATHVRPWATLFHPVSEPGYELLAAYLRLVEGHQTFLQSQIVAVDAGISLLTGDSGTASNSVGAGPDDSDAGVTPGYEVACLGGTFDHLHPGHKLLLHATALLLQLPDPEKDPSARRVLVIGVSVDELLKNKKFAEELEPWDRRVLSVLSFLRTILDLSASTAATLPSSSTSTGPGGEIQATFHGGLLLVRCVPLNDPFGPTVAEERIDVIAVSGETRGGGKAINDRRTEKGWAPLDVFEVDVLDATDVAALDEGADDGAVKSEDFTAKISSTTIRQQRAEARTRTA